jgi:hypothetical protein
MNIFSGSYNNGEWELSLLLDGMTQYGDEDHVYYGDPRQKYCYHG